MIEAAFGEQEAKERRRKSASLRCALPGGNRIFRDTCDLAKCLDLTGWRVAEWFHSTALKTGRSAQVLWVRIAISPVIMLLYQKHLNRDSFSVDCKTGL